MTETNDNRPQKRTRRSWLTWVVAGLAVLLLSAGGFWFYAQRTVESTILAQLTELDFGQPRIGSVAIATDGVKARQVEFFKTPEDQDPWLTIGQLSINHPLSELIAGTEIFDQIDIDETRAIISLDELTESQSTSAFDLKDIRLPAKTVQISDSTLVIRQPDRQDLELVGMDATLTQRENEIGVEGEIAELLGGQWTIQGDLQPSKNSLSIALNSQRIKLEDGQWQQWPGLPKSLENYIRGDVEASANIQIVSGEQQPLTYQADVAVQKAALQLPAFDLPITIRSGTVGIAGDSITYQDLVATTNGTDRLVANGSTTISGFPTTTTFNTTFEDLDVATIRHLVTEIPLLVRGQASGTANGTVAIDETWQTTLELSAAANSDSRVWYGRIHANPLTTQVEIQPLVLTPAFEIQTLEGTVRVTGDFTDQSVADVFSTFELDDLSRQLEIDVVAAGKLQLDLPLATIDKIETWSLNVAAETERATISRQPVTDLVLEANLVNGSLIFPRIDAVPVAPLGKPVLGVEAPASAATANLNISIDWPLTENAAHPTSGELKIQGTDVPAGWLVQFINQQIENADPGAAVDSTLNQLTGAVNLSSQLSIDVAQPESMLGWKAAGQIRDSQVTTGQTSLNELAATLDLDRGLLNVSDVTGDFAGGGDLNGSGQVDLVEGKNHSVSLATKGMPLKWLANVVHQSIPASQPGFAAIGLDLSNDDPSELDGKLTATVDIRSNPASLESPWNVDAQVSADSLTIKQQPIRDLELVGTYDSQSLKIKRAVAMLADNGSVQLSGGWQFNQQSGQGDVAWEKVPIGWIVGFGWKQGDSIGGMSSGNLHVIKTDLPPALPGQIPISVEGQISASDIEFQRLRSRQIAFDIKTENGSVAFQHLHADDSPVHLDLEGQIGLASPYPFKLDGSLKTLPLAQLFASPSVTERIGTTKAISGVADAKFDFQGDLSPWDWRTSGEIAVAQPRYGDQSLSDLSATWSHVGNDWAPTVAKINAFGGTIELVELNQAPQRIKIDLNDLDSRELTSLADLPIELEGKIAGDASLNDWSLAETRWADLNLSGASVVVGPAELGDFAGKVEYRNQKLSYSVNGRFLDGKLTSQGETLVPVDDPSKIEIPWQIKLTNGSLGQLYGRSNAFRSLRPLLGSLSANFDLSFGLDRLPQGSGVVQVGDLRWNNKLLSRQVSTELKLSDDVIELQNLKADLRQGEVSGHARIPIKANVTGTYQLDIRSFDLQRMLEIAMDDPIEAAGLFDARFSGRIGRTITGDGTIGVGRASVLGLTGRTLKVPIQFRATPLQRTARIELRRSRFQMFNGTVMGSAAIDLGSQFNLTTDLNLTNIDTGTLFAAIAGLDNQGQGKLSGELKLRGTGIRSSRDLSGSFTGQLDRAEAFKLPILTELANFLGGSQFRGRDFDSDQIELVLNQGRVEVRQLNFSSSLAQVAISGQAFLDGRLDLDVAARIEQFSQPTLLDQWLGSPLAQLSGSPVAFFARAAEFLSDRLVFVNVGGTVQRPQFRLNSSQQLREETIRYFLQGLPYLENAARSRN